MSSIPIADKKRTSYENFVAECPLCGKENIFNRASDFCSFEPIGGRDVSCQSVDCGRPFRIVGDSVNNRHEMLIFDCYELIERKHYMNCILSLAQAYEVFFSLYFRVELIYKPFGTDRSQNRIDHLNCVSEKLYDNIKKHGFGQMRALFLHYIVTGKPVKSLEEAKVAIDALPDWPKDPKDAAIESLGDANLVLRLKALKSTSIHTLRNSIVHKQAYRPTIEEVETTLNETRSILFPLTHHLQLYDDISWYTS